MGARHLPDNEPSSSTPRRTRRKNRLGGLPARTAAWCKNIVTWSMCPAAVANKKDKESHERENEQPVATLEGHEEAGAQHDPHCQHHQEREPEFHAPQHGLDRPVWEGPRTQARHGFFPAVRTDENRFTTANEKNEGDLFMSVSLAEGLLLPAIVFRAEIGRAHV